MVSGKVCAFCVALWLPLVACGGESTRHTVPRPAPPGAAGAHGADGPDGGGTAPDDAGTAPDDAGTAPDDGGTAPDDGGTAPDDAGANVSETIDDMDPSGDPDGPLASGFYWSRGIGNWFVTPPLEGRIFDAPIEAIEPPRGTSTQACHAQGTGYAGGVDLWAQLQHPQGNPVDLSPYAGFAFWARLASPSGVLRAGVNQASVFLEQVPDTSAGDTQAFSVGPVWELFVVRFADISADPSAVVSIDFITGEGGEDFDLWVDDLALVCDGSCPVLE